LADSAKAVSPLACPERSQVKLGEVEGVKGEYMVIGFKKRFYIFTI